MKKFVWNHEPGLCDFGYGYRLYVNDSPTSFHVSGKELQQDMMVSTTRYGLDIEAEIAGVIREAVKLNVVESYEAVDALRVAYLQL